LSTVKKPQSKRPPPLPQRPAREFNWSWVTVPTSWVLLTFAALATYWNSFEGRLFFDDLSSVIGNPYVQVFVNPRYWQPDVKWTSDGLINAMNADIDTPFSGRPLVSLSFALNHWWAFSNHPAEIPEFYGVLPPHFWYYHVVNFGLHLAVAILLFHFARRTFRAPNVREYTGRNADLWATALALIWVVHPINTETVVYVTQRTEQIISLFLLLMMYCGSRSNTSGWRPVWMVASVVFCAAGMASKENMVAAPLLMVLYDRAFYFSTWKESLSKRWGFYIPLFLCYGVLMLTNPGMLSGKGPRGMSVGFDFERMNSFEYLVTQCWCLLRYLRITLIPTGLCVDYGRLPILDLWHVVPGAIVVLSLLALTVWGWFRHPWVGFLGCWFFFILAPTSSFIPIVTEVGAERRMYLPVAAVLVGIGAALAALINKLPLREKWPLGIVGMTSLVGGTAAMSIASAVYFYSRTNWEDWMMPIAAVSLGGAICALLFVRNQGQRRDALLGPVGVALFSGAVFLLAMVFSSMSYARNSDYLTDSTLYGHIPKVFPWNERGCNNYAKICIDEGRIEEAEGLLNQALTIDPEYSDAFTNRGIIYHRRKEMYRAIQNATEAIRWNPLNPSAWNNRGNAFIELKLFDRAAEDFSELVRMNPRGVEGYYGRANTYYLAGKLREALRDIEAVIERSPGDYKAYNTKGNIHKQLQEYQKAVAAFNEGVKLLIAEARSARHPCLDAVVACLNGDLSKHQIAMQFGNRATLATLLGNRADAYRNMIEAVPAYKQNMFDDLTRAIIMHPENPLYFLARGQQHFNHKNFPQALADFDQVLRTQPNNADALRGRILALYEMKRWDELWAMLKALRDAGSPVDEPTLNKWRQESGRDYPQ